MQLDLDTGDIYFFKIFGDHKHKPPIVYSKYRYNPGSMLKQPAAGGATPRRVGLPRRNQQRKEMVDKEYREKIEKKESRDVDPMYPMVIMTLPGNKVKLSNLTLYVPRRRQQPISTFWTDQSPTDTAGFNTQITDGAVSGVLSAAQALRKITHS